MGDCGIIYPVEAEDLSDPEPWLRRNPEWLFEEELNG